MSDTEQEAEPTYRPRRRWRRQSATAVTLWSVPLFAPLMTIFLLFEIAARSLCQETHQQRLNHALIDAIRANDLYKVVRLLRQGADANARDQSVIGTSPMGPSWQWIRFSKSQLRSCPTALLVALRPVAPWETRYRRTQQGQVAYEPIYPPENLPLLRALLQHGADVNVDNGSNSCPLHEAIDADRPSTIHLLLSYGENVNDRRFAPLVEAAQFCSDHLDVIGDMLRRGAHVNQSDVAGETALMYACQSGNVKLVRLLLAHHANVKLRNRWGITTLQHANIGGDSPNSRQILHLLRRAGATK